MKDDVISNSTNTTIKSTKEEEDKANNQFDKPTNPMTFNKAS